MKTQFLFISIPLAVNSKYLTRQEAAGLLNVDLKTIYTYSRNGKLKAYHFGFRVFFKSQELVKFITNKL